MAVFAARTAFFPAGQDEDMGTFISVSNNSGQLSGYSLTPREKEIVALILTGETNAVIARNLFISESTVKKHINNVFRKLGITSRWELLKLIS